MNFPPGEHWVAGRVRERKQWTSDLFSLVVEANVLKFEAGQFTKLGLPAVAAGAAMENAAGGMLGRAYSFLNTPDERPHEFYCVRVHGGPFSPLLAELRTGDVIYLSPRPSGFLVLSEVPDAQNLWLISTGTGIAPFLSILKTPTPWQRFSKVVLVQGTRFVAERIYQDMIGQIRAEHPLQFTMVSVVSGDLKSDGPGMLRGRIPQAITDGRLEKAAGAPLTPDSAQVMLCGNPGMIAEVTGILKARGMRKHRRRAPGHITAENYW